MTETGDRGDRAMADDIALVAIGRNEGERLRRCLDSVFAQIRHVVYVDSGSRDGSIDMARSRGAAVVELDMTMPFTAARARNAGLDFVAEQHPDCQFVQFVDGDCEVEAGWLSTARAYLAGHPSTAAVFGRRKERFPERSIYNQMCDDEWLVSAGDVKSCGGDVMMRVSAVRQGGGYRPDLIAGEEPELCVRLRQSGWVIHSLNLPMTLHDAAMLRFGQWWQRTVRAGYAFAQGAAIHGAPPERHWVRESRRAWLWGAVLPVLILVAMLIAGPTALLLLAVYPAQIARLWLKRKSAEPRALLVTFFQVLGKFPEAVGQCKFLLNRIAGRSGQLIEYK